jgi:CrcB protein
MMMSKRPRNRGTIATIGFDFGRGDFSRNYLYSAPHFPPKADTARRTRSRMRPRRFLQDCATVGAGAAVGGILRFAAYEATVSLASHRARPWATVGVNVLGSFVLGCATASTNLPRRTKLLLGTGVCGAFTTFSAFSVDVVGFLEAERFAAAAGYVCATNAGAVSAALAGFAVARRLPK